MVARHAATLERMQGLSRWQPAASRDPNPDLFAPPRHRLHWWWPLAAAAAVLVAGWFLVDQRRTTAPDESTLAPATRYLRVNERQALTDGSRVELREGSHVVVHYSARERRVKLQGGEAHFVVARDPARPFVVEAGAIAVRAVGTSFNVRLDAAAVDVLVTEGQVQVEPGPAESAAPATAIPTPALVSASPRVVVPLTSVATEPAVVTVTPAQVREALAWQAPRLQFHETPLAEAVAEFNRHNRQHLILGEAALGAIPIGGTFRVDNVEGFVRLLEVTVGIRGEARGSDAIVLRRER
jgi:transmembrane sensor